MTMKILFLLLLVLACGCAKRDPGYNHLMDVLTQRQTRTCEQRQYDGSTCYTVAGDKARLCSMKRDDAAEAAAKWIERNIPVDNSIHCCGEVR